MSVTGEFRHGTIRPTLLFAPARAALVAAKAWPARSPALVLAVAAVALTFGIAWTWLQVDDVEQSLGRSDLARDRCREPSRRPSSGRSIGVGVGAVDPQPGGCDPRDDPVDPRSRSRSLMALVPSVGRFAPGVAADAVSGAPGQEMLSPLASAAVLALWALAFVVAGSVVMARRDVP